MVSWKNVSSETPIGDQSGVKQGFSRENLAQSRGQLVKKMGCLFHKIRGIWHDGDSQKSTACAHQVPKEIGILETMMALGSQG